MEFPSLRQAATGVAEVMGSARVRAPGYHLVLPGIILFLGVVGSASAQQRVVNTFGPPHGLAAPPIAALAQDSVGFIWIGAEGGLFRFDGTEMVRWAPDRIPELVMDLAVSPDGRVVVWDAGARLLELDSSGVREVATPWALKETTRRSGRVIAFDSAGGLWMHFGDSVGVTGAGGSKTYGPAAFGGEVPRGLLSAEVGALVLTNGGLWRADATAGAPQRLLQLDAASGEVIAWAVEPEAGRVLALVNVRLDQVPKVVEIHGGVARDVSTVGRLPAARAVSLLERNGTIWVALDRFLAAVRPGERPELLGHEEGFESGGPLLVDREGSLWVGSFVGLHQYPEPDTRTWAERQGIPSRHTRFLARSGSTVWVMTGNGPATVRSTDAGLVATPTEWDSRSFICALQDGTAWTAGDRGILEIRDTTAIAWPDLPETVHGCAQARDGGVWLGTPGDLIWIPPDRSEPDTFEPPYPDRAVDPRPVLLRDREDRLWVGAGASICSAPEAAVLRGERDIWHCEAVANPDGIFGMVQLADGRLWAAAGPAGLLEYHAGRWAPRLVPGAPTQTIQQVVYSPLGGAWIVGDGMVVRTRTTPNGTLEILERITPWHGLAAESAGHIAEDASGDLWLATSRGVVHVPSSVRFAEPGTPPVALVEARVDNEPVHLEVPLVLPHDRNRLEVRFAALSFRHREGLRHQVRLSPDEPWTESGGEPSFRWVDLPAGTYHVEYRASRDGRTWSTTEAGFTFRVAPPWYASSWFLVLAGLATLGLGVLVYRARVEYLLGLEQQRTRIAMDLHDQVGSGLASVGILSGVMATDSQEPAERQRTARDIALVAEELGHSLSDIVWALDPRTASLEELATRLAEHGERLFPDEDVRFEARLPDRWPPLTSSMAVRRSVLLIGLEALHNAAQHAGAKRVTLSMEAMERGRWELRVHDDGGGIRPDRASGAEGRGLDSMARRAEVIGGTLRIDSNDDRGTTVTLSFRPQAGAVAGALHRMRASVRTLTRMIMRRRSVP